MFAAKSGDKAATADFASRFETTQDVEEVAPFGDVGFSGEEIAKEDSVASEELAGKGFEGGIGAAGFFDSGWRRVQFFGKKGPTAGSCAGWATIWSFCGGGFAARVHAGTELVEAIGRRQAGCGEFPERVLGLEAGEVGDTLEVVGEAGSPLLEEGAELECVRAEGSRQLLLIYRLLGERLRQPIGCLADVEGDRCSVGRDDATRAGCLVGG